MNRIRSSNEAGCIPPASREVLVGRVRKLEKRIAELEQAVRAPSKEIERLGDTRLSLERQILRLVEPLMQIARILEKEDNRW